MDKAALFVLLCCLMAYQNLFNEVISNGALSAFTCTQKQASEY